MTIAHVVGARPQFVKMAAVSRALRGRKQLVIHSGQHYDYNMSQVFFEGLRLPRPDVNLGIGSGPQGAQTARMLAAVERVLIQRRPDAVLVYGDTNTTLAGALAAAKLRLPVGHVEAGCRSYDRTMPEEVNRVLADHLSRLLFAPTRTAAANLRREAVLGRIEQTGDVMLDVARQTAPLARRKRARATFGLSRKGYALVTLHRPANVDDRHNLSTILQGLDACEEDVLFPVHPRTHKNLRRFRLTGGVPKRVRLVDPVGYIEFLSLLIDAERVVTDSGGVQKEAFFLGVPCITVRSVTEWPETVAAGWNVLVGADGRRLRRALRTFSPRGRPRRSAFGTGHAAEKIAAALRQPLPELNGP